MKKLAEVLEAARARPALAAAAAIIIVVAFAAVLRRAQEPHGATRTPVAVQSQPGAAEAPQRPAQTVNGPAPQRPATAPVVAAAPVAVLPAATLAAPPAAGTANYQLSSSSTADAGAGEWVDVYRSNVPVATSIFSAPSELGTVPLPTGGNIRQVWSFVFNAPVAGQYTVLLRASTFARAASASVEIDGVPDTLVRVAAFPGSPPAAAAVSSMLAAGWHRARVTLESPAVDFAAPGQKPAAAAVFIRAPGGQAPVNFTPATEPKPAATGSVTTPPPSTDRATGPAPARSTAP